MATGFNDTFNAPQFSGELFAADSSNTPLLSMIGGLTGGLATENEEFPTAVLFDYPAAKQPAISEVQSVSAPTGTFLNHSQGTNVVQIFHDTVEITYVKQSNSGKLSGINNVNGLNSVPNELDWQIAQRLKMVARDVEYTFINGVYAKRNSPSVANKTRGLLSLISQNVIDGKSAALSKDLLNSLYKAMADNGAYLDNMVIFVNSSLKQKLTEIYSSQMNYVSDMRNVGGVNIMEIETDFFKCGIAYDRFMPQNTLLVADVAHIAPVFQTVPGKGNFFLEELAKTGASEKYQLFGQIGLAHGPEFLHGKITNLTA